MSHHPIRPIRPARPAGLVFALTGSLILVWSIPAPALPGLDAANDDWFRQTPPAEGLLAVLRLVVLTGLLYLLAVTMLIVASTALRSCTLDRVATHCTGPALQRLLRSSVGLGIGTLTSLHSMAAGAAPPPPEGSPEPVPAASADPAADETTTLTRLNDPAPAAPAGPGREAAGRSAPPASEPARAAPTEAPPTDAADWWTVAPGDHLWHIAEETLVDHGATAPSLDHLARYWHTLCQANHDRLVDPGNPDLIMPGQRIALPPVPSGS